MSNKPADLNKNGSHTVEIRSLQGRFEFKVHQFHDTTTGNCINWLAYMGYFTQGNYISTNLKEYSSWLSLSCSYNQSSLILKRQIGESILSDQSICQIVENKAIEVSNESKEKVVTSSISSKEIEVEKELPLATDIDIYDSNSQEILLLEDGIQVKGQKKYRSSKNHPKVSDDGKNKRWITDISSLQQPNGSFIHFTNDIENDLDLSYYIRYQCFEVYKDTTKPLKIVSIIDACPETSVGAKTIRKHLTNAFNQKITYILDWYHLRKKCNELLSMVAYGRKHREELVTTLLAFCWKGEVVKGIDFITNLDRGRNEIKHSELINYLTKHQKAIINYEKRQDAGKLIGSGQMESAVNEIVGRRQKDNGMAWSQRGTKALALLQIAQLNGQWEQIWSK